MQAPNRAELDPRLGRLVPAWRRGHRTSRASTPTRTQTPCQGLAGRKSRVAPNLQQMNPSLLRRPTAALKPRGMAPSPPSRPRKEASHRAAAAATRAVGAPSFSRPIGSEAQQQIVREPQTRLDLREKDARRAPAGRR